LKVEIVNFIPTELIIENYLTCRKIGKICYICGACGFSSISTNSPNILGTISVKPINNIRDTIAISNQAWNPPESVQYIIFDTDDSSITIHTNTNYQSKYLYGSYVFVCK